LDTEFVNKLCLQFEIRKIDYWLDSKDIKWGDSISEAIHKNIEEYDRVLLVISKNSINSKWVEEEFVKALEIERKGKCKKILPIMIDPILDTSNIIPVWVNRIKLDRMIGELSNWKNRDFFESALSKLLLLLEKT